MLILRVLERMKEEKEKKNSVGYAYVNATSGPRHDLLKSDSVYHHWTRGYHKATEMEVGVGGVDEFNDTLVEMAAEAD